MWDGIHWPNADRDGLVCLRGKRAWLAYMRITGPFLPQLRELARHKRVEDTGRD